MTLQGGSVPESSSLRESAGNYAFSMCHCDAYMDVGGTTPRMESVESSQDAYRDIGGRATQEAKAEQRPRATSGTSCRGGL